VQGADTHSRFLVAERCSALQCVAVCRSSARRRHSQQIPRCSVLQCVAVCCRVLQCVAGCCSVLQCVAAECEAQTLTADSSALTASRVSWMMYMSPPK